MVKKSLRQFTLMATATVTLLLGLISFKSAGAGYFILTTQIRAWVIYRTG
ncbi:hypothetical protein ACJ8BY_03850 [Klebsiella pneumoniae]